MSGDRGCEGKWDGRKRCIVFTSYLEKTTTHPISEHSERVLTLALAILRRAANPPPEHSEGVLSLAGAIKNNLSTFTYQPQCSWLSPSHFEHRQTQGTRFLTSRNKLESLETPRPLVGGRAAWRWWAKVHRGDMGPWLNGWRSTVTAWKNTSSKDGSRITVMKSSHSATRIVGDEWCGYWCKGLCCSHHSVVKFFSKFFKNGCDVWNHVLVRMVRLSVSDQLTATMGDNRRRRSETSASAVCWSCSMIFLLSQ